MTAPSRDLEIRLPAVPGALATLGEALGGAGVSVQGGGAARGVAHFLVGDAARAREALTAFEVVADREVVMLRLDQARPGQLGLACRRMADAGVTIEVLYSDHDHQLCLVVDDPARGRRVAAAWAAVSSRRTP